jgi:hypothetical protein
MTIAAGSTLNIRHLGSIHLAEQVHHCVGSSLRDAERVHAGEKAPVWARLDLVKDDVFETQPTNIAHFGRAALGLLLDKHQPIGLVPPIHNSLEDKLSLVETRRLL